MVGLVALAATIGVSGAVQAASDRAGRLQACFISLNEPGEVDMFRSHLDREQFQLVDLGPQDGRPGSAGDERDHAWLLDFCVPEVQCDLLVISGEFAGDFFGTRGWLSLQAMEEASCQARCAGIFRRPREVFLLGCNTLATKDEDSRSPDAYLRVLLEHGFDRALAERVVELRYGPLGPSFRESLRRIFAGVPHLYGFGSVAPRSRYSAPMVERYLHATPDYEAALARTTSRNTALQAAFAGTALSETTGLSPLEPAARDRAQICALYDESRPVADRLRVAYGLVLRPDALRFVPTLQVFLARHPPQGFAPIERSVLLEMRASEDTRAAVLDVVRSLDGSALQLELAHFAALVGWIDAAELHALAVAAAGRSLRGSPTSEAVDVLCEIVKHEPLRDDFGADDIPPRVYADTEGLRLIACLAPSDPRVAARVLPSLRAADPLRRRWAAYALTQLRPSDPNLLAALVPYLRDPSPDIAARIRWLFDAQSPLPTGVRRTIDERAHDS